MPSEGSEDNDREAASRELSRAEAASFRRLLRAPVRSPCTTSASRPPGAA